MSSPRQFAFLSFLDLISCAFGASVLVFVVAATSGSSGAGAESIGLMFINAVPTGGNPPEVEFQVQAPGRDWIKSSQLARTPLLPSDWVGFAAPKTTKGGTYLVIPKPDPGIWKIRMFWTDGTPEADTEFHVEVFCPRGDPVDRLTRTLFLSRAKRFSEPIRYEVR